MGYWIARVIAVACYMRRRRRTSRRLAIFPSIAPLSVCALAPWDFACSRIGIAGSLGRWDSSVVLGVRSVFLARSTLILGDFAVFGAGSYGSLAPSKAWSKSISPQFISAGTARVVIRTHE